MANKKKGAVSAGHNVTASAAIEILSEGGNAYDAILAAYMAACVAEPTLTSLGGGGYLLAHTKEGRNTLYDFFVQTPGSRILSTGNPDFYPVTVDFGTTKQDFHIGMGAIAVPGGVRGVFDIHADLGSLPLARIAAPAIRLAREGVLMNDFQVHVFDLLDPIFRATPETFNIYKSIKNPDTLIRESEVLKNPDFANYLEQLAKKGSAYFYEGEVADIIVKNMQEAGGYITHEDLKQYTVAKREPLATDYRGNQFITNPPPSSGGILIAFALKMLETQDLSVYSRDSADFLQLLARVMDVTNVARKEHLDGALQEKDIAGRFLDPELLKKYKKEVEGVTNCHGSTTQISVIDGEGNCASMTTSNGEGSGYVVPGTGIMLNNMLGEEDLHPQGFHQWDENERVSSMMAPSVLLTQKGDSVAIGSGGSNRIRTAILQALVNYVDFDMDIESAVEHPRIHFERGELHVEPGLPAGTMDVIRESFGKISEHAHKGMFFGGTHAVVHNKDGLMYGAGDERRSGVAKHS